MVPWRTIFFSVNFVLSVSVVAMCVRVVAECVGGGGSAGAFMGGVCFIWPAAAAAVAEWVLYVRKVRSLEQPLGAFCGLVGLLALYALISTVSEAAMSRDSLSVGFWLVFGSICLAIAAYGLWCAWLRIRRQTMSAEGRP